MIDYGLLHQAQQRYTSVGYKLIEVPWLVGRDAIAETVSPHYAHHANVGVVDKGFLVGSAEQSFIQMMIDGALPTGAYQAITPCFRGDSSSHTHRPHFIKLELIIVGDTIDENTVSLIIGDAQYTMSSLTSTQIKKVATEEGFDLVAVQPNGTEIEVGSYGFRRSAINPRIKWVYGTGLAEPRFSTFCQS